MKRLILLFFVFSAAQAISQEKIHLHVGNTHQNVKGYRLLPDSLDLDYYCFYNIVNGYFDYFYYQEFDGKILQFDHFYCPVEALDFKAYNYDTKDDITVLTINTVDEEPEIMVYSWTVDGTKTSKAEFNDTKIELFITDEEVGKLILKQIKKGNDL